MLLTRDLAVWTTMWQRSTPKVRKAVFSRTRSKRLSVNMGTCTRHIWELRLREASTPMMLLSTFARLTASCMTF